MNAQKIAKIIESLDICTEGKVQVRALVEEIIGQPVEQGKINYVSEGDLLTLKNHPKTKYTVLLECSDLGERYSLLVDTTRLYHKLNCLNHDKFVNKLNEEEFQYV